jgi:hypothetical protein
MEGGLPPLIQNKQYSDVMLYGGESKEGIPGHRIILSVSPVLSALIEEADAKVAASITPSTVADDTILQVYIKDDQFLASLPHILQLLYCLPDILKNNAMEYRQLYITAATLCMSTFIPQSVSFNSLLFCMKPNRWYA